MAWYKDRSEAQGSRVVLHALNPIWSAERLGSPLQLCTVENIRKAVELNTDLAVVFPTEGEFRADGSYKFYFPVSDRAPIHIANEVAFILNVFISQYTKVEQKALNEILATDNGRTAFLNLVSHIYKNNNDGGMKVESDSPPPDKGPGNNVIPLFETEPAQVEA